MTPQFSIGTVLATGFRIWVKNLVPFMFITVLLYSPVAIWQIGAVQGTPGDFDLQGMQDALKYGGFLLILINIMVSAALTYGVVMELQGQRASLGASIGMGIKRFLPALGTTIVAGICVSLGTLLLVVPGIIVFSMLYVATPASVIERQGVFASIQRSNELTQGHKLQIFGLVFLLGVIGFGLQLMLKQIFLPGGGLDGVRYFVYALLLQQAIVGSVGAVMSSVAYYYLRAEKEGTSASELASVFD